MGIVTPQRPPGKLSIGQLARRVGVGVDTVRFYERRGLLLPAARGASGYRIFDEESVRRLHFVRHAQGLGFTLEEIRELLALRVDRRRGCAEVRALALTRLVEIEARLKTLMAIRDALAGLAESCRGAGPTGACPLLDALDRASGMVSFADPTCKEGS